MVGESVGGGGSVVCVSAALGPSAHPPFDPPLAARFPSRLQHPLSKSVDAALRMSVCVCQGKRVRAYVSQSLCITPYKHYFHVLG